MLENLHISAAGIPPPRGAPTRARRSVMLRTLPLLAILLLPACTTATAVEHQAPLMPVAHEYFAELALESVEGLERAVIEVGLVYEQADPAAKAAAAKAGAGIVVACPFNRASFQLPQALLLAAERLDASAMPKDARAEWDGVVRALRVQVALLHKLGGAGLPLPSLSDPLAILPLEALVTQEALRASRDPLAVTGVLIDAIQPTIEVFGAPQFDIIEAHRVPLRAVTTERWPTLGQYQGTHHALERILPKVQDPATRATLQAMRDRIADFLSSSC